MHVPITSLEGSAIQNAEFLSHGCWLLWSQSWLCSAIELLIYLSLIISSTPKIVSILLSYSLSLDALIHPGQVSPLPLSGFLSSAVVVVGTP